MKSEKSKFKILENLKGYLIFLIILIAWYIVCEMKVWNAYILPPPQKVFETFLKMLKDGSIFINIYVSMKRVLIGFFISAMIGIPLGIFFGM